MHAVEAYEETLRKLSVRDDALVGALLADEAIARDSHLDEKTHALVRVAALIAVGVPRVVSAAPKVGLALGYDVDAALEEHVGLTPE